MSTDVTIKLEDARVRLEATQQRADDVEAHAQRILEVIANETEAWNSAIEDVRARAADAASKLGERWAALQQRVSTLEARAREEWNGLGENLTGQFETRQQQWAQCATTLAQIPEAGANHEQRTGECQANYRQFVSTSTDALSVGSGRLQQTVIADNGVVEQTFETSSTESMQAIRGSLDENQTHIKQCATQAQQSADGAVKEVEERRVSLESEMDEKYNQFNTDVDGTITRLKESAQQTQDTMNSAAEAIGNVTSTLVSGGDEVVEVLSLTNVGLNTVVDIVQTGIDLCEEVIDCWSS